MTDACTKYAKLFALPTNRSSLVTDAIFKHWICPVTIHSDQGKKFVNQLSAGLYKLLNIEYGTSTAYTPQCNAQIEHANQTIKKYLAFFVNDDKLDWEDYLVSFILCYNTSFHRSITQIPHFLTFGFEPNMPSFLAANV
jgi:hypothetical protein